MKGRIKYFDVCLILFLVPFFLLLFSSTLFSEPLSSPALQTKALAQNPRIKAMEQEVEMMQNRIPQSGALDDPRLKIGLNNIPSDRFSFKDEDMTTKEIGISQMIPLWGKLSSRERIAQIEYDKSIERLQSERINVLHMLRINIYDLQRIQATMSILNEIKDRLKLLIDSQIAANKSGVGSLDNVIKANIEYTMIDEEVIDLIQKEREARQEIGYLVGGDYELKIDAATAPVAPELNTERIRQSIHDANPDLKILRLDREMADEEILLKQKEYYPDVEIGLSYMQRDSGPQGPRSDMISAMASINLPIWHKKKNDPMVMEMQKKSASAANIILDKTNELDSKAEILISQIKKWHDLYMLYQERIIPQASLAIETNMAQYKTGEVEFMSVIDTIRQLLRYKKELITLSSEYHKAHSELNALLGLEITP
jgi:cobalt-zinc-cadmium efflux system outer membrane protein